MKLDRIDRKILRLLQNDGRISNRQLAEEVGLAASTCSHRVNRLREAGVLLDMHATVEPEALGIGLQALVSVSLKRHSREAVRAFHLHALSLDEVRAAYHVTGPRDFVLHLAVRDTDHLRDVTMDAFTTHEEVANIETSIIYEFDSKPVLPDLVEGEDL